MKDALGAPGAKIERKMLQQWFRLKITDYAEELLLDLNQVI